MHSPNPTRRQFLGAMTAAVAAPLLPGRIPFENPSAAMWFLHTDAQDSWPVDDPVVWSLENAHHPVLERASEGLSKLTANDCDRIVRLVVRRCRLNLVERRPGQVVVNHWGPKGLADLRPFFRTHGLARPEIEVVLLDRKKEVATVKAGDDFRFGVRLAADFAMEHFVTKWCRRFKVQDDDGDAAPGTWSGYAWEGVESNRIPWRALKSAWRMTAPLICPNCDQPTFLSNFGWPWIGMFSRSTKFVHVCGKCRRSFTDESIQNVEAWMAASLDDDVQPDCVMMWTERKKRKEATRRDR